ncbi:MAG TPA: hypothetical protein V6D11_29350 [Waterburya sp.]|jgi:hypothetical protein
MFKLRSLINFEPIQIPNFLKKLGIDTALYDRSWRKATATALFSPRLDNIETSTMATQ